MNNTHFSNNLITPHKITTILLKSCFSSLLQATNYVSKESIILYTGAKPASVLISEPTFKIKNGGVIVQVFYYIGDSTEGIVLISDSKKKALSISIAQLYPNINVELQVVQQNQPYINASILAQYLAINASKYGFHRIITILFSTVPYYNPSTIVQSKAATPIITFCITGLKVQLSGLLTTQRNRARKTVYTMSAGTFKKFSLSSLSQPQEKKGDLPLSIQSIAVLGQTIGEKTNIDYAESFYKSREGAFNIKVSISSIPLNRQ